MKKKLIITIQYWRFWVQVIVHWNFFPFQCCGLRLFKGHFSSLFLLQNWFNRFLFWDFILSFIFNLNIEEKIIRIHLNFSNVSGCFHYRKCDLIEAIVERCSVKNVFLEISQNSQENTCARVSFLIKFSTSSLKKRLWTCVFCEFCEISKNTYFYRTGLVAASGFNRNQSIQKACVNARNQAVIKSVW